MIQHQNTFSEHASQRLRARAISPSIVTLVLTHGEYQYSWKGSRIYFLPLRKIDERRISIPTKIRDKLARCPYVVISAEGKVITAGFRHKRIKSQYKRRHIHPRRV